MTSLQPATESEAALAAAGSLVRPDQERQPRLARRLWLVSEMLLFYVGAPLAIVWAIREYQVPLFVALQTVLIAFIAYLLWDSGFLLRRELAPRIRLRTIAAILATFLVLGSAITYATWVEFPQLFLAFPIYRTELWQFVVLAYPLMSVAPQELIYRTFFFHRYGPLFGNARGIAIVSNGLLFGFGHIIFWNPIAVIGTAVIGILLAYRYETTRSFWAVWLEHSLYGVLVFTVGLGGFFFTGVSSWR